MGAVAAVGAWVDLAHRLGATAPTILLRSRGADLLARWGEPHRQYHNRRHLAFVLNALTTLAGDSATAPPTAQGRSTRASADCARMAAWYHDAVYDPARSDNEEHSAALASMQLAGVGVGPAIVGEVERLVLLTRTHEPSEDDVAGQLLCDADLAILAAPPDVYDKYTAAVRAEHAQLPDHEFRVGRGAVLRALADRESLFRTRRGQLEWERPARANLVRELAMLGRTLSPGRTSADSVPLGKSAAEPLGGRPAQGTRLAAETLEGGSSRRRDSPRNL